MAEMPMMPGLNDDGSDEELTTEPPAAEGGGSELTSALDAMTDAEFGDLTIDAENAYAAGELDELMSAAPVDAPEGELGSEVDAGGDTLGEDPAAVVGVVSGAIAEVQGLSAKLQELAEAVDESEGDVDVSEALEVVEEALGELETALSDAQKAESDMDPDAAAEAKKAAEDALEKAKKAAERAIEEGQSTAQDIVDAQEVDSLAAWAERNG